MARLLCLCARPPYPLTDGGKIRVFHTARLLAAQHEVDLLVVEGEDQTPDTLSETFSNVVAFSHDRTAYWRNAVRGAVTGGPVRPGYYAFDDIDRWLDDNLGRYDGVLCYYLNVTAYVRNRRVPKLIDFVDCLSKNYLTRAEGSRWFDPRGHLYRWEGEALARYERAIFDEFDQSFVTTPEDGRAIAGGESPDMTIVPNGVDQRFLDVEPRTEQNWIVFLGRMDYHPNIDAVRYFAANVFPRVRRRHPDAEFVIVGGSPTQRVRKLDQQENVRVTGFVDQPEQYLASATVVVAPMRYGSGLQNKVLEGMAVGKPVVTTPLGADGIQAEPGEHLLTTESDRSVAETILDLFEDPERRQRIGEAARERIQERYTWEAVAAPLRDGVLRVLD
jgi:sugar transferase (PEP-CTERM/EpsH1 system associated)